MLNKDNWFIGIGLAATVWLTVFVPALMFWPQLSGQISANFVKAGLLASIPNIILLRYFFVKRRQDKTAKGILIFTFIIILCLFILEKTQWIQQITG